VSCSIARVIRGTAATVFLLVPIVVFALNLFSASSDVKLTTALFLEIGDLGSLSVLPMIIGLKLCCDIMMLWLMDDTKVIVQLKVDVMLVVRKWFPVAGGGCVGPYRWLKVSRR
jgi:hypothetical protein